MVEKDRTKQMRPFRELVIPGVLLGIIGAGISNCSDERGSYGRSDMRDVEVREEIVEGVMGYRVREIPGLPVMGGIDSIALLGEDSGDPLVSYVDSNSRDTLRFRGLDGKDFGSIKYPGRIVNHLGTSDGKRIYYCLEGIGGQGLMETVVVRVDDEVISGGEKIHRLYGEGDALHGFTRDVRTGEERGVVTLQPYSANRYLTMDIKTRDVEVSGDPPEGLHFVPDRIPFGLREGHELLDNSRDYGNYDGFLCRDLEGRVHYAERK